MIRGAFVLTWRQVNRSNMRAIAYPRERSGQEAGMTQSTQYSKGTVLTCEHEGCGCRVRIEEECHCPSGGRSYTCACGAPLVEAD